MDRITSLSTAQQSVAAPEVKQGEQRPFIDGAVQSVKEGAVSGRCSGDSFHSDVSSEDYMSSMLETMLFPEEPVSEAESPPPIEKVFHYKKDLIPWVDHLYASAKETLEYLYDDFVKNVNADENLSPAERESMIEMAKVRKQEALNLLTKEREQNLEKMGLNENPHKVLLPNQQVDMERYKHQYKLIAKHNHGVITDVFKNLLPAGHSKNMDEFIKDLPDRTRNLEGFMRFKIIHQNKIWNPEHKTELHMALRNPETGRQIDLASEFVAAGPGYSSTAPRNRTLENTCIANFFRTAVAIDQKSAGSLTRSAITVEFDVKDPKLRKEANQKLVKQMLDVQVMQQLGEMSLEELEDATQPIVVKSQTVNLLTPDILREKGKALGMVHAADDERTLALENLAAHQHWGDQVEVPYTVRNKKGEEMTVFVKFDIRYFNVPNNSYYDQLRKYGMEGMIKSDKLEKANEASFVKLEEDVNAHLEKIEARIAELDVDPEFMGHCQELHASKKEIRTQEMNSVIKNKGAPKERPNMGMWQQQGKVLAGLLAEKGKEELSPDMQEMVALLTLRENLTDMLLDTKELYRSGMSKDSAKMGNNRSAFTARLIALGVLCEDVQVHFGCRSGKDRTGLVDIEIKLLFAEMALHGRVPSYWEQESLPGVETHRNIIAVGGGNTFELVEANVGSKIGMNTGGAACRGPQFEKLNAITQGNYQLAERAKTSMPVTPVHQDKFSSVIEVKA